MANYKRDYCRKITQYGYKIANAVFLRNADSK